MKKSFLVIFLAVLFVIMASPVAATSLKTSTVLNNFDTLPSEFENAEFINFDKDYVDGTTNAIRGSATSDYSYVYLKEAGLGDYSIKFSVPEDGTYEFVIRLMGWSKSVTRSTDVRIDDSEKVYFAYDYEDADQYKAQYWTGISVDLTAGEHTITLSLSSDFDNATVKSLYFRDFAFIKVENKETVAPETEAPATEAPITEEPATEAPVTDVAPTAPKTADKALIAVSVVALCGCATAVLLKKKK